MNSVLTTIISAISSHLSTILISLLACLKEIFTYLNGKRLDKKEEQQKKEQKEFNKKAENVVNNGTLEDLLDLKRD